MTSLNDTDVSPLSCIFTNGSGLPVPLPDPDPHENIGYTGSKLNPSLLRQVVGFYFYKYLETSNENCLLPPALHGWWLKPAQAATELRSTETREVSSLPEFYRLNSTNKAGWFFLMQIALEKAALWDLTAPVSLTAYFCDLLFYYTPCCHSRRLQVWSLTSKITRLKEVIGVAHQVTVGPKKG